MSVILILCPAMLGVIDSSAFFVLDRLTSRGYGRIVTQSVRFILQTETTYLTLPPAGGSGRSPGRVEVKRLIANPPREKTLNSLLFLDPPRLGQAWEGNVLQNRSV